MIEEFANSVGRVGGWCQAELSQRPDLIHGFSTMFDSGLSEADSIPKAAMTESEGAFPEEASSSLLKLTSDGTAFTLRGVRFLVVRHFWNSLCIVSEWRREGVVVCHLTAGILLVCTFRRPVLAPQAVLAVEQVFSSLWQ